MNIQEAISHLSKSIEIIYPPREAENIAKMALEFITGKTKTDLFLNRFQFLNSAQLGDFQRMERELLGHRPIQYVLEEAWFYGLKFYVDENVLIPRPETEELVEWIIRDAPQFKKGKDLILADIGTGSGCIAIVLKKKLSDTIIFAVDASESALLVAKRNAIELGANVEFLNFDFLDPQNWVRLPLTDVLVSNPPYIPFEEKESMTPGVVDFEPSQALFVPNNDPLVFYHALASFGQSRLAPGGSIYAEIHESLGNAVVRSFEEKGWAVELKKDMQGKDRMIRARRD